MAINRNDGKFQVSYWRDASKIEGEPDAVEYSDFLMELKQRIHGQFRERRYMYAAVFSWDESANTWHLVDEFEPRT